MARQCSFSVKHGIKNKVLTGSSSSTIMPNGSKLINRVISSLPTIFLESTMSYFGRLIYQIIRPLLGVVP